MVLNTEQENVECSQSPIFSWDRLDIPRLTVTAILIFKCTEGAGVGDYSSLPPKPPPPPKENDVIRTDEISFLQTFRVQIRLFLHARPEGLFQAL